jgi:hypothetical protein
VPIFLTTLLDWYEWQIIWGGCEGASRATFTTPPNFIPLYTVIENLKSTPKKKIRGVGGS